MKTCPSCTTILIPLTNIEGQYCPVCDYTWSQVELERIEVEAVWKVWQDVSRSELFERANRAVGNEWKSSLPGVEK